MLLLEQLFVQAPQKAKKKGITIKQILQNIIVFEILFKHDTKDNHASKNISIYSI